MDMAYYKGTLGLIGNTPLVEVTNIEKELGLEATVLVKLEYFNPAGSVKDGECLRMEGRLGMLVPWWMALPLRKSLMPWGLMLTG